MKAVGIMFKASVNTFSGLRSEPFRNYMFADLSIFLYRWEHFHSVEHKLVLNNSDLPPLPVQMSDGQSCYLS